MNPLICLAFATKWHQIKLPKQIYSTLYSHQLCHDLRLHSFISNDTVKRVHLYNKHRPTLHRQFIVLGHPRIHHWLYGLFGIGRQNRRKQRRVFTGDHPHCGVNSVQHFRRLSVDYLLNHRFDTCGAGQCDKSVEKAGAVTYLREAGIELDK
jgi:hypothetical protein